MTDQERPGFGDDDSALTAYSTKVEDIFPPPFWAERKANGQLERGAQLPTRDGRRIGNAWLMGSRKMEHPPHTAYKVITDIGTELFLSAEEINELFYPPSWIGNQEALNEVRQSAARKAQRL